MLGKLMHRAPNLFEGLNLFSFTVLEYFKSPQQSNAARPDTDDTSPYSARSRFPASYKTSASPTRFPPNYAIAKTSSPARASSSVIRASSPLYAEERARRPFDELSPVYGSPSPGPARRRTLLPNVTQASNNSSLDNSW